MTCWCRRVKRRTTLLIILLITVLLLSSLLALVQQPSGVNYTMITYQQNKVYNNYTSPLTSRSGPITTRLAITTTSVPTTSTVQKSTTATKGQDYLNYIDIFRQMLNTSKYVPEHQAKFKTVMNESEMNLTLETLAVFARTMDLHNLTYFLYGGTLIGSLRHHGPIPWDDDIDVIVDKSKSVQVWKALQTLSPDYVLTTVNKQKFWKLYSKKANVIYPGLSWKWPFVDIWLYEDSGDSITDWSCPWCRPKAVYPKRNIFPLKKRPFGPLSLYTPCKSRDFLNNFYKWEHKCDSRFWNHRKEQQFSDRIQYISCKSLEKYFPFVKRTPINGSRSMKESLMYNGLPVSSFVDSSTC